MLAYSEPVSFAARDSETGKLAGVIINIVIDPSKPPPPSMKSFLDPQKEPVKIHIANFLEDLEEGKMIHIDPTQYISFYIIQSYSQQRLIFNSLRCLKELMSLKFLDSQRIPRYLTVSL
jgi:hypothetical protein